MNFPEKNPVLSELYMTIIIRKCFTISFKSIIKPEVFNREAKIEIIDMPYVYCINMYILDIAKYILMAESEV